MELTQVFFGRILICLASGIYIGYLLPISHQHQSIITICCGVSFLIYLLSYLISRHLKRYTFRYLRGIFAYLFLIVLGITLYHIRSIDFDPNHFSKSEFTAFQATLKESMKSGANSSKGIFEIEHVLTKNGWKNTNGKLIIYVKQKTLYPIGTILTLKKQPQNTEAPLNPNQFDYAAYLNKKYINHTLYIQQNDIVKIAKTYQYNLNAITEPIRKWLKNQFQQYIPNHSGRALVQGLLLGDKSEMDQEISLRYSQVGLAHILAVSGFHTALIYQILFYVFVFTKRLRGGKYLHITLVLSGLWFYAFLTGLSPSVTRAATMLSLLLLTKLLKRQPNNLHILSLAACFILLFNPNTLFDLGFQLSFCAVLGIFTINKSLKNLYKTEHKILKPLWESICISTSAQLFTIPIILFYFHQFPLYFIVSNLATLLPVIGIIYLSILLISFSWLSFIAEVLGKLITAITQLMDWVVTFISTLPTFTDQIYIQGVQAILVLLTILFLSHGFSRKKVTWIYCSYIFIIAFWGIQHTAHFLATQQKTIAIFHVKNHSVIALINGKQSWLFTDIPDARNSQKIRQTCLEYMGANKISIVNFQKISGNMLIKAWGKTINISNGKPELLTADYQLLHHYGKNATFQPQNCNKLIIDGSNKKPIYQNETCYQTSLSGAFIEHF